MLSMEFQKLIEDRHSFLVAYSHGDLLAYQGAKTILGLTLELNKLHIPLKEAYMYQCMDLGSPLNKCLRKAPLRELTSFLNRMYNGLLEWFEKSIAIDQDAIVFRGIPKKDLVKHLEVGDDFFDPAFNSVSLDPYQAEYFGDVIFAIKLKRDDKVVYINGHENFYSDVFECLLPPGNKYRVIDIVTIDIHGSKTCYIVEIIGKVKINVELNDKDDDYLKKISEPISILKNNDKLQRKDWFAVVDKDNFYFNLYELGHFDSRDDLYQAVRSECRGSDEVILDTLYWYARFLKDDSLLKYLFVIKRDDLELFLKTT